MPADQPSDISNSIDLLDALTNGLPLDWDELSSKIKASSFSERWRRKGQWATEILQDRLGNDWIASFMETSGQPYLKFALAGNWLPCLAATVELAASLFVLEQAPGINRVLRILRTQLDAGSVGHASVQLQLAALELRRTGTTRMEPPRDAGHWQPDVELTGPAGVAVGVECFLMVIAAKLLQLVQSSPGQDGIIDGWQRVGARIADKSAQASQEAGWLRCELDDGMFGSQPWFQSALSGLSLSDKGAVLSQKVKASLVSAGTLHGTVITSVPSEQIVGADGRASLPGGGVALRTSLSAGRRREIFILPTMHAGADEVEMWHSLFELEGDWLAWALPDL